MNDLRPNITRRAAAEALAAFALVFAGCAAGEWSDFWLYVPGPLVGGVIGAFACQLVRGDIPPPSEEVAARV